MKDQLAKSNALLLAVFAVVRSRLLTADEANALDEALDEALKTGDIAKINEWATNWAQAQDEEDES